MVNMNALIRFGMLYVILASVAFATTGAEAAKVTGLVTSIYCMLTSIFPIIIFTLMVLAAVAYGAGQFFGADTRAKATTWAMACLSGAVVALIIYLLGPMIIKGLYTGTVTEITCV